MSETTTMNTKKIIISARGVKKDYSRGAITHALKGVSLDIHEGDFCVIKGESGCGKTTLINLLSGLDDLSEGEIVFKDSSEIITPNKNSGKKRHNVENIAEMNKNKRVLLLRKVGIIFQNAQQSLIPYLDALDNVAKGIEPLGLKEKVVKEKSIAALEEVGLEDRMHHLPSELSGGQCQRVAIARAIVKNPIVIFADEPTGNLDPENAKKILQLLDELNKKGRTIVMVTHSEKFNTAGKRVVMMEDGMIQSIN